MPWLVLVAAAIAVGIGWMLWRRAARRKLAEARPDSFILSHDPLWTRGLNGERDRTLGLVSAVNLRDIGGYPALDGKRVRWELVYRSGTLNELSAVDALALSARGLKLICDFRSEFEVKSSPDDADRFGARYEYMPFQVKRDSLRQLRIAMFRPRLLRDLMRENYIDMMLERNAPLVGRFLTLVADEENLPVLFHCTAGKDRTGMAAMVLLALLGVPDNVIAADYSLSNQFYANFRRYVSGATRRLRWFGLTVDDLHPLLIADPALMHEALDALREKYGSIDGYVTGPCGVDSTTVTRLRELLLEDAA